MKNTLLKNVLIIIFIVRIASCQKPKIFEKVSLDELSITDTLKVGAKAGMHLGISGYKLMLGNILKEKGFENADVQRVWLKEMSVKVIIPESDYNPDIISGFSTAFSKTNGESTVLESSSENYTEQVYTLAKNVRLNGLEHTEILELYSGLKTIRQLEHNIIFETYVRLQVELVK